MADSLPVIAWCSALVPRRALQAFRRGAREWLIDEDSGPHTLRATVERVIEGHRAGREQRDSSVYFRAILDQQQDPICRFGPDGALVFANDAYCRRFGAPNDQACFFDDLPADERTRVVARLDSLSVEAPSFSYQMYEPGEATPACETWTFVAMFDASGEVVEYQATVRDISQLHAAISEVHAQRESYRALYENAPVMMYVVDAHRRLQSVNRCWEETLGVDEADAIGRHSDNFIDPASRAEAAANLQALLQSGQIRDVCITFRHRDGRRVDVQFTATALTDAAGQLTSIIVVGAEITERLRTTEALQNEKDRLRTTLASIADAVITTDPQGCIDSINAVAQRLCECPATHAIGKPLHEVFMPLESVTRQPELDLLMPREALSEPVVAWLQTHRGQARAVEFTVAPIRHDGGDARGSVLVFRDTTQAHELSQRMHYQAHHDPLTGLLNRRAFENRLERVLGAADPSSTHVLCYLDLDRFKHINDSCGHAVGDRALCELSDVLRAHLRERDMLARLGGDEFAIVLEHCPIGMASELAERIRADVAAYRLHEGGLTFSLGVSIGMVALKPPLDAAGAVRAADSACYAAKEAGRDRMHLVE